MHTFGPSLHDPLSEYEVYAGTILGRRSGPSGKGLRDKSREMRERFSAIAQYTVASIIRGDIHTQGLADLDLLYDDDIDREVEALPRAIACLTAAMSQQGQVDQRIGELVSFKYIAAGVCLRELQRYWETTVGSSQLPRVERVGV